MEKEKPGGALRAIALTTTISMEMAITVTIGFFGGRILDRQYGTEPWLLVAGVLLGVAAGIWGIVTTLERFFKDNN